MSLLIRHWPYMVYLPSCHSTLRKKRCAKLKNVFVRVILPQIWYTTRAPFQKKPSPRYDHYDVHAHMATSEKCYNIYITVSSVLKKRTSKDDNFQLRHTDYSSKWPPLFCMQNSSHIKIQYDIILKIFYSFSSRCQETAWFTALFKPLVCHFCSRAMSFIFPYDASSCYPTGHDWVPLRPIQPFGK